MAEIKLQKRVVYAGDVHIALLKAGWGIKEAVDFVKSLPEADVALMVRCKDCKHYHSDEGWCDIHSHFVDGDGEFCYPSENPSWKMFPEDYYCADGERKSGTQPQREDV